MTSQKYTKPVRIRIDQFDRLMEEAIKQSKLQKKVIPMSHWVQAVIDKEFKSRGK